MPTRATPRTSIDAPKSGVSSELDQGLRKRVHVLGPDQSAALAVGDDGGDPADRGRDDRQPEGHRLDDDAAHSLVPRRHRHDVRRRQIGRDVGGRAGHPEPLDHAERPRDRVQTRPLGPIAHEQHSRRRDLSDDARQRAHQEIEALVFDKLAYRRHIGVWMSITSRSGKSLPINSVMNDPQLLF